MEKLLEEVETFKIILKTIFLKCQVRTQHSQIFLPFAILSTLQSFVYCNSEHKFTSFNLQIFDKLKELSQLMPGFPEKEPSNVHRKTSDEKPKDQVKSSYLAYSDTGDA